MSARRARRAWAAALRKHRRRGRVLSSEIAHDDWCHIHGAERVCTCTPTRTLRDLRGRVLARVDGAGEYDPVEWLGETEETP